MNFEIGSSNHKQRCLFSVLSKNKKARKSGFVCPGIEYTHFPVEIPPQALILLIPCSLMLYVMLVYLPEFLVFPSLTYKR